MKKKVFFFFVHSFQLISVNYFRHILIKSPSDHQTKKLNKKKNEKKKTNIYVRCVVLALVTASCLHAAELDCINAYFKCKTIAINVCISHLSSRGWSGKMFRFVFFFSRAVLVCCLFRLILFWRKITSCAISRLFVDISLTHSFCRLY